MVIMASPRADSISSPKKGDRAPSKAFAGGSTKKKAVGSPNLRPPPKYEMPEDWPEEGPIDLNKVSGSALAQTAVALLTGHRAVGRRNVLRATMASARRAHRRALTLLCGADSTTSRTPPPPWSGGTITPILPRPAARKSPSSRRFSAS
jgi:hypothetical protein